VSIIKATPPKCLAPSQDAELPAGDARRAVIERSIRLAQEK
ncbi:hypothetical protein MJI68_15830, partial [Salmonella enterica subsp. enterica serovar Kentucky]|nr:hypothetical protein [Salmonella enterica subsp. enterica serovar Kentucky]